jgi:hypothetical protein
MSVQPSNPHVSDFKHTQSQNVVYLLCVTVCMLDWQVNEDYLLHRELDTIFM